MVKTKDGGSSAVWDDKDIHTFCDICIAEIEFGNRPTTHFNKEGWANIVLKFKNQTGKGYDRVQMKNKWDHLKKEWKLWRDLKRGETGLGWNSSRKTIDASDEWWDERLRIVPAAKKFRFGGIAPELEEKLNVMFSTVVAAGGGASTFQSRAQQQESINEREVSDAEPVDISDTEIPLTQERATASDAFKRRRKGKQPAISTSVFEDIDESSKHISRALYEPIRTCSVTIADAYDRLHEYPDVYDDEDFYDYATIFLLDEKHREAFMAIPKDRCVKWLRNRYTRGL